MRWCERHGIYYILGLARNPVLEEKSAGYMIKSERAFTRSGTKELTFGSIRYAAKSWDRGRRVIVKAERMIQGPNMRFIVTNLSGNSRELYQKIYCQRGEMKNRIKDSSWVFLLTAPAAMLSWPISFGSYFPRLH